MYDEGNRDALAQSLLGDLGPEVFFDGAAYKELEKSALVWIFTVNLEERDSAFHAQWWVGPPPAASEVARKAMNKPQAKRLQLPTGQVRVEGNEAISIGPHKPLGPGVSIQVPPGTYDLSLFQAPLADGNVSSMFFLLVFTPVGGGDALSKRSKASEPRKGKKSAPDDSAKQYRKGLADGRAGKPAQSTSLHYKRGWRRGNIVRLRKK